jgi:hypothetical protein
MRWLVWVGAENKTPQQGRKQGENDRYVATEIDKWINIETERKRDR